MRAALQSRQLALMGIQEGGSAQVIIVGYSEILEAGLAEVTERYDPSRATLILVLGILGLTLLQILAPVAWWLGTQYVREAKASGLEPEPMGDIGRILGMIGTIILIVVLVMMMVFVVLYILFIVAFFVIYIAFVLLVVGLGALAA